jgi:hypothetical protein
LWEANEDHIVVLHYTVSKGWQNLKHFNVMDPADSMHCWIRSTAELCALWEMV